MTKLVSAFFACLALSMSMLILVSAQDDLSIMSNPNSNFTCPMISDGVTITSQPVDMDTVNCNTATPNEYPTPNLQCIGRCCLSTGNCFSSACDSTFNQDEFNCGSMDCHAKIQCNLLVTGPNACGGPDSHCVGTIHCVNGNGDCLGKMEGDLCLTDGVSDNFKICFPHGFIVGDPQFVGLRGQSFQIHGVAGEVYNIVSDADLQYNSRFVFLDAGECPVVNGKKQKGCFAHPGSYLGELGLKTRSGEKIRYLSGSASNGFMAVEVNGKQVELGETIQLNDGFVSLNSTHLSTIKVGSWQFDFENSDMFINQRVAVTNPSKLRSHGLLGQTWKHVTYPNAIKYIQGEVDDYVIRGRDIFGDEFVFNAFN